MYPARLWLSDLREGALLVETDTTVGPFEQTVRALPAEAVVEAGGSWRRVEAGQKQSLKDMLSGDFLECRVSSRDAYYDAERELMLSVSAGGGLRVPRLGCINVHSALLPHYRGMLPTFWALAQGERQTGVTVHYMTPGIDGGDIVAQRTIPISPQDTLHSLMRTCKRVAADAVIETVEHLREGSVSTIPNPADEGSYYSFPAREDVRRFKAAGRRLR